MGADWMLVDPAGLFPRRRQGSCESPRGVGLE
jgi:hypothetical protein